MRVQVHDRLAPRWQLAAGVVLLALLATLATFQYRWLGAVSEAERARMRESLQTRASEFATDFDREITRTYLAFQFDTERIDRDPGKAMAAAYAAAQTSGAARIVRDVFLIEGDATRLTLRRLDAAAGTLTAVDWPRELAQWRGRVEAGAPRAVRPVSPIFLADAVDAAAPALLIPVPRMRRFENDGHLAVLPDPSGIARAVIVWLDAGAILSQLVEPLAARHFGAPATSDYVMWIAPRDDPQQIVFPPSSDMAAARGAADVTTGLFDLRMDEVSRAAAAAGVRAPEPNPGPGNTGRVTDKVAITIIRRANGDGTRVLMTGGERQGAWQLRARYRGGSLDALVAQFRRRNLAIGLGVLGLLASSFVLITAAALRQQRLARQQMEFVAAVSHELRTPLAVICSAGENLADGVVADAQQVKRYGSLIETEGRRLGDMVERVLQFAGISAGTQSHVLAELDVAQVIADAVAGVAADARDRGVTVRVHTAGALPRTLGDADALRSAVRNVVGNAVKYSAGGATVDITTELIDSGVIRIRVADRGIGIDASDLPHLFKPFFRGQRAIDAQVRGTGVGLAVVRQVVRLHGGDVRVDSTPGEGTTVTILLPVQASAERSAHRVVRLRHGQAS